MTKKRTPRRKPPRHLSCEGVEFAEVEFPIPVRPRVVVRFSEGLGVVLENESAVDLAASFIVAFREAEKKGDRL